MEHIKTLQELKIGVLGGGQLGRMMMQEAIAWNLDITFLDKSSDFPVPAIYPHFTEGDFTDYDSVLAFGQDKDILTIEIENVNVEALMELESMGKKVYPQPIVIYTIKDKGLQKEFYRNQNLPTADFFLVEGNNDIIEAINSAALPFPFIQKARTEGYDGKGVVAIRSAEDLDKLMDVPSVIEELVDLDKELAVIVGRNEQGQVVTMPMTEMVFDERGNLLDYLLCPAEVEESIEEQAVILATRIIESLDMVGILAVEFFLDKKGKLSINEVAPRAHNSGHHTMNSGLYSQYNLHLRTLLNLDLPEMNADNYSVMWNILGDINHTGIPVYSDLQKLYSIQGVYPHLYGKKLTKPLRKMGHVNIVGSTKDSVLEKLQRVKSTLKVIAHES